MNSLPRIIATGYKKGLKTSPIAEELSLHPLTVEKWMAQPSFQPRKSAKRSSKLDAFKGQIIALLERHPYSAQQILQQLQPQGYHRVRFFGWYHPAAKVRAKRVRALLRQAPRLAPASAAPCSGKRRDFPKPSDKPGKSPKNSWARSRSP